ncbi:MAG: rod shape-determining protein [Clostridia bacterium]|nr:rod shape-determining protein [Clostridia bacterium]
MQWNIGIDLGSRTARMTVRGRGSLLRQSSCVAFRGDTAYEFGDAALEIQGRELKGTRTVYPMDGGQIADEAALSAWLGRMLRESGFGGLANRARVLLSCPALLPFSQKQHLAALTMQAGAANCALLRADTAAAIGAGVPVLSPKGHLVADIGASHMSVTLFSLGRAMICEAVPWGLTQADAEIRRMLLNEAGLRVGMKTAENVRLALASAVGANEDLKENIAGLSLSAGFPRVHSVSASDVHKAVMPLIDQLIRTAESVLWQAPDEFAADLSDTGVVLTGGGANLFGLEKQIAEHLNLPCRIAEDPGQAALRGLNRALDGGESIEAMMEAQQSILERRRS